jgi:putative tryptophan/tyrosine transport system substrate-binding protein
MRRREFIRLFGGAIAAGYPLVARAQQTRIPVVGYLSGAANSTAARSFRQGLSEEGFVEGRNVVIETRNAEGQLDRLQAMAADLSRRQVSAIVALGIPGVTAARTATTTIPIVFLGGFDPVAAGFVASLNRPGGNLTGITTLALELGPKRLELLHELVPGAASIALLANPANSISAETQSMDLRAAARTLGLPPPHMLYASSEHDFEAVFAALMRLRAGGLVITNDSLFNSRTKELGTLALRHALPTVFQFREFVAAGGLVSYSSSLGEMSRLVGVYTGRILKGEKPADLPVQRATKVELIINLKTAKALGLTVPLSLRGPADEVIE